MKRIQLLSVTIALLLVGSIARAAVPSEISIQGVLRNNTGQLQTMPVDLKIEFFDAESGGTSIAGPYTKNALVVTNGLFNVQVADATLPTKFGNAAAVWVEVTVNNTDVFPRQKVTSEAFALRAAVAENLSCNGCILDGMIAGVAAAKVSGKVASATAADTASFANGLSCTGCVTNAMIIAVDGSKVMNAVALATNSTQLGGVAAASYQRVLNNTGASSCPANQAITGIAASGTFSCSDTIANAANATTATTATTFSGTLGGDVTGNQGTTRVDRIRTTPVSATAPTANQVLRLQGGTWVPDGELAGVKAGSLSNLSVFTAGTLTSAGTITVMPPTAGQVVVTVNASAFGIFTHTNGTPDRAVCCLSTTTNSCTGASVSANVPRSWPTHPGGVEGIEFPFSLTSSFPYSGTGSLSVNLLCQYSGSTTGMYLNGIATTAMFFPRSL